MLLLMHRVVTCVLGLGSFIGSLFGMNLVNRLEDDPYGFPVVTGSSVLLMCSLCIGSFPINDQ